MGKNVSLKYKENNKEKKDSFFFLVKDQGEGAAKVLVIILKILELALTTIYGVVLGIFGPVCVWYGDIADAELASDPVITIWLITSIIYIIGLFAVMLGFSKIASAIHTAAAIGTLMAYTRFGKLFAETQNSGPSGLYMPCLFITVITILIMLLINVPKWIDKGVKKANEEAPSILGDSFDTKKQKYSKRH